MSKQSRLDELKQQIIKDNVCPELAKGATQLVFGDGTADAELVFIGEAPGVQEDIQGKPFVGAAGKFLNEMLEMIGLKRQEVYITNIVKYRPPSNRDPYPEEKTEFLPHLLKQLEIIEPKIVITLGRHSLNCFLPDLSISAVHGQPKRIGSLKSEVRSPKETTDQPSRPTQMDLGFGGTPSTEGRSSKSETRSPNSEFKLRNSSFELVILPLFHPAAALYNSSMKQTLIDDFMKIPVILKKVEAEN